MKSMLTFPSFIFVCLSMVVWSVTSFSRVHYGLKRFRPQLQRNRRSIMQSTSQERDNDNNINNKNNVRVTLETASNSKVLQVQKGEILRTALLRRGASPHNGKARLINCRGLGTCGTCAVEITSTASSSIDNDDDGNNNAVVGVEPKERNTRENLRLNFPPHGQSQNLRLACQVQVTGDIVVRKGSGFWGQDSNELAEEYEAQLWFGEMEYILDNKSPTLEDDETQEKITND